jgi:hypothetical protein
MERSHAMAFGSTLSGKLICRRLFWEIVGGSPPMKLTFIIEESALESVTNQS